jgi:signal transduction histidine kinase
MGLGLAIIKNIIENYNGTITFESEPTIKTTFIVTLPIL